MKLLANGTRLRIPVKLLRIMRITAFLLFITALHVSAKSDGQTISYSGKNVSLETVFSAIKQQTGYVFFYKVPDLNETKSVTVELKNVPLTDALTKILANQNLGFAIEGNTIVISRKSAETTGPAGSGIAEPAAQAVSPPEDIHGKLVNDKGEPVNGASIVVKGTTKGTTTNGAGEFTLAGVDGSATLVISGANIETAEIKVAGRTSLNITAKIKVSAVDEVQIIGYGSVSKRFNTGNVATVKGEEIKDRPVGDVMQALQGKLSGVSIQNSGAGLGATSQVIVRGVNSITSGTNPLIVVDGVVVNDKTNSLIYQNPHVNSPQGAFSYTDGVSSLNYINPIDIESVDVLKDADATSIYGSRGTNGVILITTKKASMGKTSTTVNLSTGWKTPTYTPKRLNTEQYLQLRKDAFAMGNADASSAINPIVPDEFNAPDLTVWSQTAYTDFQKMVFGNSAPNYNASVSMSGGNKALNFVASGDYYKMYDDYMFKPYQERTLGRLQLNHMSMDNKFILTLGATVGSENQQFTTTNMTPSNSPTGLSSSPTALNPPNFPLYKSDGSLNPGTLTAQYGFEGYNPYFNQTVSSKSATNNVLLNGLISYAILDGLVVKLQAAYNSQDNVANFLFPSTALSTQNSFNTVPYGTETTNNFSSTNFEPQVTYNHSFSKLNLSALGGLTFLDKKTASIAAQVNNPGSDDLLNSWAAGQPTTVVNNNTVEKYNSIFGRMNLDWEKTYILNLNYRRDGSSKFGPDNRYANFWSAGFAWIFSNASFVKNGLSFLSFGKLRGSHGTTGNSNIADYQYLGLLQTPNVNSSGAIPGYVYANPLQLANYPNPDIKWEQTAKTDISLELGLLNNRIYITGTWYKSLTTDLLTYIPIAPQSGVAGYYGNFPGEVQNTGLEFELTTQNSRPGNPLKWTTKFNLSTNKNMLKSYPGLENTGYAWTYQVGRALPNTNGIGSLLEFPYHFTGIDPSNGLPLFKDVNGDGVVDYNDGFGNDAWFGTSRPTLWGGFTNTVSYKNFTFDIFFTFTNGIFTKWNAVVTNPIGYINNPSADVVGNYWKKPGDVSKYPRLFTTVPGDAEYTDPIVYEYPISTAVLYKGYFIRLKNVQLTYSFKQNLLSKLKLTNAQLYVSCENLAFWAPVKLYKDPEISSGGDANSLLRTFTTGIRFQF